MFSVARELMSVDWVSQSTAKILAMLVDELQVVELFLACSFRNLSPAMLSHSAYIVLGHFLVCIYHQNTSVCVGVCV